MATPDNISKLYKAFSARYDNFSTEEEFRQYVSTADALKMQKLYDAFAAEYDNFDNVDQLKSYVGWQDPAKRSPQESRQPTGGQPAGQGAKAPTKPTGDWRDSIAGGNSGATDWRDTTRRSAGQDTINRWNETAAKYAPQAEEDEPEWDGTLASDKMEDKPDEWGGIPYQLPEDLRQSRGARAMARTQQIVDEFKAVGDAAVERVKGMVDYSMRSVGHSGQPVRTGKRISLEMRPSEKDEDGPTLVPTVKDEWLTPQGYRTTDKWRADMLSQIHRIPGTDISTAAELRRAQLHLAELEKQAEEVARANLDVDKMKHPDSRGWFEGLVYELGKVMEGDKMGGYRAEDALEDYSDPTSLAYNEQYQALRLAITEAKKRVQLLENAELKRTTGEHFWRDFGRSAWQVVSNPDNLDFGERQLANAGRMLNIAAKADSGKPLTEEEQQAMYDLYQTQLMSSMFGDLGRGYRWGNIAGYSALFAKDFLLTGGGFGNLTTGLGRQGAMRIATRGATKAGVEMSESLGSRLANEGLMSLVQDGGKQAVARLLAEQGKLGTVGMLTTKALGAAADDLLLRAPIMTNTIQLPATMAEIIEKKLGDVEYDATTDKYKFKNENSFLSSLWQVEGDKIVENASELAGARWLGVTDMTRVLGARNLTAAILRSTRENAGTLTSEIIKMFERAGINGLFGEVGEEYYGQLLRTGMGLDTAYNNKGVNNFFDPQWHGDTWGGLLMSIGMSGAGGLAVGQMWDKGVKARNYLIQKHRVNRADAHALNIFGADTWDPMRSIIDATTNEEIGTLAESIDNDSRMTPEQRKAALTYIEQTMIMRGFNLGEYLNSKYRSTNYLDNQVNSSYMDGYNLTEEEMGDAKAMLEYQRQRLADTLGEEAAAAIEADPADWVRRYEGEERGIVLDYANAKAVYDGMIHRVRDDIDEQIAASDAEIDSKTHRQDGVVQAATMKLGGRRVHIIDGYIEPLEGGMVDSKESDPTIVVRDEETGKLEIVSPADILYIEDSRPWAEQVKEAAREKIRQRESNRKADLIDGKITYKEGDRYHWRDEEGNLVEVTVTPDAEGVIETEDGKVNVMVSGSDQLQSMDKGELESKVKGDRERRLAEHNNQHEAETKAVAEQDLNRGKKLGADNYADKRTPSGGNTEVTTPNEEQGSGSTPTLKFTVGSEHTVTLADGTQAQVAIWDEEDADGMIGVNAVDERTVIYNGKTSTWIPRAELERMLGTQIAETETAGVRNTEDNGLDKPRDKDVFPDSMPMPYDEKKELRAVRYIERDGIGAIQYANPETGLIDVVIAAQDNGTYAGYFRVYDEDGQPTNRWSSKFENQNGDKSVFARMMAAAQELMPAGHEYTETTSVSTDGLRVMASQLRHGYEIALNEQGAPEISWVPLNQMARENNLGVEPNGDDRLNHVKVKSQEEFERVKAALTPLMGKFGLGAESIRLSQNGTVMVGIPVMRKKTEQRGQNAEDRTTENTQAPEVKAESTESVQANTPAPSTATNQAQPNEDIYTSEPPTTEQLIELARQGSELAQMQLDQQGVEWRQPEQPASALDRVPKDEAGKPQFHQTENAEDGWDGLVEHYAAEDFTLEDQEDMAMAHAQKAIKEAKKRLADIDKIRQGKDEDDRDYLMRKKRAEKAVKAELAAWEAITKVKGQRAERQRAEAEAAAQAAEVERQAAAVEARKRAEAEAAAKAEADRKAAEAAKGVPDWRHDNPANARERGYRMVNGEKIERQAPLNLPKGQATEVTFTDRKGDTVQGHYAIVDLDQTPIHASHMQGERNPHFFINEAQPKERTDQASAMKAREHARDFRVDQAIGGGTAYVGEVVVNNRGEVIQGNGRRDMYEQLYGDPANAENAEAYRQALMSQAERYGVSADEIAQMGRPMAVRVLDVDDAEAIRLGQFTAQDTESGGIERLKPKNVAMQLGKDMRRFADMLLRTEDEEESLSQLIDRNGAAVLQWMRDRRNTDGTPAGVISATQYQSAFDSRGNLTGEAKNDLQKVLWQAAFSGVDSYVEEVFSRLPAKAQKAILATAYRDMDSPEGQRMLSEIQKSILAYAELLSDPNFAKQTEMEAVMRAVDDWKEQTAISDTGEIEKPSEKYSNFALHLAALYRSKEYTQRMLTRLMNDIYDLVQGTVIKEGQMDFGDVDTAPKTLVEAIREKLGIDYEPAKNSVNDGEETKDEPAGGSDVAVADRPGEAGQPGSEETHRSGEQTETGKGTADGGGRTAEAGGEVILSDELDENGHQFVLSSNGTIDFGVIDSRSGLPSAPIRLSEGVITNQQTKAGYGLVHIEARHGKEIRNAGYASVLDFIQEVAQNYQTIREGANRHGEQTYLLQLTDKHNNTLIVELSKDGEYWNINTAGIFKTSYARGNKVVYDRQATVNQPAGTDEGAPTAEHSGTQAAASPKPSTTVGKGSEKNADEQEGAEKSENVEQPLGDTIAEHKDATSDKEAGTNPTLEQSAEQAAAEARRQKWTQILATEPQAMTAAQRRMVEEAIKALDIDAQQKAGALRYLRGENTRGIAQIYYQDAINKLKTKNDAGDNAEHVQRDSSNADGAHMDERTTGPGRPVESRRDGGPAVVLDQDTDAEPDGSADSSGDPAQPDGAPSDIGVEGSTSGARPVRGGARERARGGKHSDNGHERRGERRGKGTGDSADGGHRGGADSAAAGSDEAIAGCLDELAGLIEEMKNVPRSGRLYAMPIPLPGMDRPERYGIALKIIGVGAKLGYHYIVRGLTELGAWSRAMHDKIAPLLRRAMSLTDEEVGRWIEEMWYSDYEIDGKVQTIAEWARELGDAALRRQVRMSLEEKRRLQEAAEGTETIVGDIDNIRESLPYLLPQQQEDVLRAETQFYDEGHQDREHGNGKGYMFTNGTGTGKTYTGLGIIKRFVKQGKKRILILTPSQKKVTDWINDGLNLGLDIRALESLKDKGDGVVITTYANLRGNKKILEDTFDLVVYDESHKIMENQHGEATIGAKTHYMLTNKNLDEATNRRKAADPWFQKLYELQDEIKDLEKELSEVGKAIKHAAGEELQKLRAQSIALQKELADKSDQVNKMQGEVEARTAQKRKEAEEAGDVGRTKVVFLSATPFNVVESLEYAEGYIFSYPEENKATKGSYRHKDPKTEFMLNNFGAGYKFRNGRLEKSVENADALSKQEIEFSDYLENVLGTKSGRIIDSEWDYSRDFPTVTLAMADQFNAAVSQCLADVHLRPLAEFVQKTFYNYTYATALFESMKVAQIENRIREHLEKGRKVVIFHRRKDTKEPIEPPFARVIRLAEEKMNNTTDAKEKAAIRGALSLYQRMFAPLLQWEQTLDYRLPREQLIDKFGKDKVLLFSGTESKKAREKAVKEFNDDNSGKDIIVIQEESGKEGISLHDTSGTHQRVLINLALPVSPITALQIEGRIYRIGNESNAIFEYPILGLDSEITLFAEKFNQRLGTTENLSLGSKSRDLRTSFANAVIERSGQIDLDQQGTGGKEADQRENTADDYDKAITDYYGNRKLKPGKERDGVDYYPTPEPLGYKMVEWARMQQGENALEPSAGHGAIARYVQRQFGLTAIEPSAELFNKMLLKAGGTGRKMLQSTFEDYDIKNKHDVILMNPPFGKAGTTAIEHIKKAWQHLDEGGRLIAIVPRGAMDKKVNAWLEGTPSAVLSGEIQLPQCTFGRAGTQVVCRVIVVDKVTSLTAQEKTEFKTIYRWDLSDCESIPDLFERLREIEMPERKIDHVAKITKKFKNTSARLKDNKGFESIKVQEGSNGEVWLDITGVKRGRYSLGTFNIVDSPSRRKSLLDIMRRVSYYRECEQKGTLSKYDQQFMDIYEEVMKTLLEIEQVSKEALEKAYQEKDRWFAFGTLTADEEAVREAVWSSMNIEDAQVIVNTLWRKAIAIRGKDLERARKHYKIAALAYQDIVEGKAQLQIRPVDWSELGELSAEEQRVRETMKSQPLAKVKEAEQDAKAEVAKAQKAVESLEALGDSVSPQVRNNIQEALTAAKRRAAVLGKCYEQRKADIAGAALQHGMQLDKKEKIGKAIAIFDANNKDARNADLMGKVRAIVERLEIPTVLTTRFVDQIYGEYNSKTAVLGLNANLIEGHDGGELAQTILHELIHAVTVYAMRAAKRGDLDPGSKLGQGATAMNRLFARLHADETLKGYGMTNELELAAELSNPRFRAELEKRGALAEAEAALEAMLEGFDTLRWTRHQRGYSYRIGESEKMIVDFEEDKVIPTTEREILWIAEDEAEYIKDPAKVEVYMNRESMIESWRQEGATDDEIAEALAYLKKFEDAGHPISALYDDESKRILIFAEQIEDTKSLALTIQHENLHHAIAEDAELTAMMRPLAQEIAKLYPKLATKVQDGYKDKPQETVDEEMVVNAIELSIMTGKLGKVYSQLSDESRAKFAKLIKTIGYEITTEAATAGMAKKMQYPTVTRDKKGAGRRNDGGWIKDSEGKPRGRRLHRDGEAGEGGRVESPRRRYEPKGHPSLFGDEEGEQGSLFGADDLGAEGTEKDSSMQSTSTPTVGLTEAGMLAGIPASFGSQADKEAARRRELDGYAQESLMYSKMMEEIARGYDEEFAAVDDRYYDGDLDEQEWAAAQAEIYDRMESSEEYQRYMEAMLAATDSHYERMWAIERAPVEDRGQKDRKAEVREGVQTAEQTGTVAPEGETPAGKAAAMESKADLEAIRYPGAELYKDGAAHWDAAPWDRPRLWEPGMRVTANDTGAALWWASMQTRDASKRWQWPLTRRVYMDYDESGRGRLNAERAVRVITEVIAEKKRRIALLLGMEATQAARRELLAAVEREKAKIAVLKEIAADPEGTLTGTMKHQADPLGEVLHRKLESLEEAGITNLDANAPSTVAQGKVEDARTLAWLESLGEDEIEYVYRAMQVVDGRLYPPMAAVVSGEYVEPSEIGRWEQADERPELATADGKFILQKKKGPKGRGESNVPARYNPYIHTSRSPLNDQFSGAYARPNLVTVKVAIPKSELTSGYKADKAKDTVGEKPWKSGPVSSELAKQGKERKVILSRYAKVVEVMKDADVAKEIAKLMEGTGISIPANTVTPSLRTELEKLGVAVHETVETAPRTMAAKAQRAIDMGEALGCPVRVITDPNYQFDNEEDARSKGWYDTATGEVVIVAANNEDTEDVTRTALHEIVAHRGLRRLFGRHFETMLDNIYRNVTAKMREQITAIAARNGWDIRTATEEYLAKLAEGTNFEQAERQSWFKKAWEAIKATMMDMLSQVGIKLQKPLTDNELRYMLWRSWKLATAEGRSQRTESQRTEDILSKAENIAMQHKLGTGRLHRDVEPEERDRAVARARYEERVATGMYQSIEALQDSMLGLKEAMEAITPGVLIEDIDGYENPYLGENRLSSVNQAEAEAVARTLVKPLVDEVSRLAERDGEKDRRTLTEYMMAKHGLERNEVMARRDAEAAMEGSKEKAQLEMAEASLAANPNDARAQRAHAKAKAAYDQKLQDEYQKMREQDYAGLTSLTGEDEVADAEAAAMAMVNVYESRHDTDELWRRVRALTGATLEKTYKSGLISEATYRKIQGMYQHYIPLRGFDATTSAEAYAYLNHRESALNAPIQKAKGRRSVADDPIAYMQSMAEGAIVQGNRNMLVKQRMLNYVLNHPSDLVSVSDLWVMRDPLSGEWEPVFPDNIEAGDDGATVEQKMKDFQAKMEALRKADPDNYKRGREAANIPYRVVTTADKRQHQVVVKRGGRDYVLTINGNPRAAQALNGLTNPDNAANAANRWLAAANRWLAGVYTTKNPDFIVSNFIRDMLYSNVMSWVKESPRYAMRYHMNFGKVNPARLRMLIWNYRKGTLEQGDETERLFGEFMANGGETGYTSLRDIEGHKSQISREVKRGGRMSVGKALSLLGERLDELNRSVELCARFAAYVTSRQSGRTIDRSIWDAKEVSVNFNKKGSGAKFMGARGQTAAGNAAAFTSGLGRGLYVFWNAGIQGLANFGKQAKRHPAKSIAAMATMYALGCIVSALGHSGDGDNEEDSEGKTGYGDLPEYVRRSNILIKADDSWVSIPLPIEYRAFYGLGELTVSSLAGKEHMSGGELAGAIAGQVTQALPIDVMEGGNGGMHALIPSAFKPAVEAYVMNESWTGLPISKQSEYNKHMPEWTKAYRSNNKHIVGLCAALNGIDGDEYTQGTIDLNPAKIEYMLNGYFGGISGTIDKLTKMGEMALGDREYDPRGVLLLNRVVKSGDERTEQRAVNREYYRAVEECEKLRGRLRNYERETDNGGNDYEAKIIEIEGTDAYERLLIYEDYQSDIKELYEELKDQSLSADERKEIEQELMSTKKAMLAEMEATRKK